MTLEQKKTKAYIGKNKLNSTINCTKTQLFFLTPLKSNQIQKI